MLSFTRQGRNIIQVRQKTFIFLYDKFPQNNTYQILSQSVRYCRLYIKKHLVCFSSSQCNYMQRRGVFQRQLRFSFVTAPLLCSSSETIVANKYTIVLSQILLQTTRCLEVTGGGSIGECGRLSRPSCLLCAFNIHCISKKVPTFKLSVTLSNLNRFSKFLHCWKAHEIQYKTYTTSPTSPQACCYTTLGN